MGDFTDGANLFAEGQPVDEAAFAEKYTNGLVKWWNIELLDKTPQWLSLIHIFPSRHAFSAFAIAASWFAASVPVAVVLLVAAGALAVCRVLGGVHFPRDVVAGAFIGSATGALAAFLAALL